ncbi:MAG: bifunctional phosphopantothenoylcysteine decarboxylase/phosphopantothenate--cysteine ligase CoaBC [Nitrospirae bacterium]|nr:bifunctional phosphopantothenoylcysteine decarboxylase/phosphopantothenate--cysteine ligase CoaBC [Nitrospirota bacterium]
MLTGKRIILGITGSIAAYKAAEIVRRLRSLNAEVWVVMTRGGTEFITPLTLQTLSGHTVYTETFALQEGSKITHINLIKDADLFLIAPATANIIGKFAAGIGDDLLTTMALAARCPVIIAPAMDSDMYDNPILQNNIAQLKETGCRFIETEEGELASGLVGKGRLANIEVIISTVIDLLVVKKDMAGEVVLVTAGPTREYLDPVRFISNRSSGKMGYAIAASAKERGAEVILISGPTTLQKPAKSEGIELINVVTASEMREEALKNLKRATIVIMAAAVSDYRPVDISPGKIKKSGGNVSLDLTETPDILTEIGMDKGNRIVVGFAAETENLESNAMLKLKRKNLDIIVANDVLDPDAGFEVDTNVVTIIDKNNEVTPLPRMSKKEVSYRILDKIAKIANLKRTYSRA